MTSANTRQQWAKTACLALGGLLLAGGCASRGDMQKAVQSNRVQDERLKALETSVGHEVSRINEEMNRNKAEIGRRAKELARIAEMAGKLSQAIRAAEGRLSTSDEQLERIKRENTQLTTALEKANALFRATQRRLKKQAEANQRIVAVQEKELDSLRLKMDDLEKLLTSPIAQLPAKTTADRRFREAFAMMIGGEMDLAADKFRAFGKAYPKDPRVADALYRRGQAFFLMRKYDHAIVPFFELVDRNPKHRLAVNARWMLARGLEETGDLKLAREFYAQLIAENTIHKADATRRVHLINRVFPKAGGGGPAAKARREKTAKKP